MKDSTQPPRIVVGVSGQRDAPVIREACLEAQRSGAESVVFVHVLENANSDLELLDAEIEAARAELRLAFERAQPVPVRPIFDVRVAETAPLELAAAADDHAATRLFVGETSRDPEEVGPRTGMWLARFAPCTLTVVRPPRTRATPRRLLEPAPAAGEEVRREPLSSTHVTLSPERDLQRKGAGPGSLHWRP